MAKMSILKEENKYIDFLMLDTVYKKSEVQANGGDIMLPPRWNSWLRELNKYREKKKRTIIPPQYVGWLNENIYVLEPVGNDRVPTHFRCVERIHSNHQLISQL